MTESLRFLAFLLLLSNSMAQSQISLRLTPQETITCPNNLQSVLPLPNEKAWIGGCINVLVKFNQSQTQETYLSRFEDCPSIDLLEQHIYVGGKAFSLSDNAFLELDIYEEFSLYFGGSFNIGINYSQWILPQKQLLLQAHYTGPDRTIGAERNYNGYTHQILLFDLASNSIIKQIDSSNEPYQTVSANTKFVVASILQSTKIWKYNGDLILENPKSFKHLVIHPQLSLIAAIDAQNELQLWACLKEKWTPLSINDYVETPEILFHPTLPFLFVLDSKFILSIYDCSTHNPQIILQEELPKNSTLLNINANKLYTLSDSNQLLSFDIKIN